jgi:signal transduction histidine kinase
MRKRAETVLPVLVLVVFLAAALLVNYLLSDAEQRGVDALETAAREQVDAFAAIQNQRIETGLQAGKRIEELLGNLDFTVGSENDRAVLVRLGQLADQVVLVDAEGTITRGALLDPSLLGTPFDWPGADVDAGSAAKAVLPVAPHGLTTEEPAFAYLIPVGGRGSFVLETPVGPGEQLNLELTQLERGDTGRFYFVDDLGSVVASNDTAAIGRPLDDLGRADLAEGVHREGGEVLVVAQVPSAAWRMLFRQDVHEFEDPLTGPLETVGRLLVLGLFAVGGLVTWLLYRRLRAARAEQQRLRALSEAQEELVSIVSHELRTPVAGVLGFLETTLDHWDTMEEPERKTAVSRAAVNARRLQGLTRDVLDTQSVESGRLVHVFERFDLREELRAAVEAADELDGQRHIDLQLPDEAVWVRADGSRLQQVMGNLLENARKSSPASEPIDVVLVAGADGAEVAVTDRGPGIAPEAQERIFDKFVRGRTDAVSGTGLGLYISRQIVEAHGGRIWVDSAAGQGATIRFTIPLEAAD